jgi:hypothetical protein
MEGAGLSARGPQRGIQAKATGTTGINYAVYAETNSSDGYAGYFHGRVKVTAPFCGRPAYDSGWTAISPGSTATLTHNLGGNSDNYIVDMQFNEVNGTPGVHNTNFGGNWWADGPTLYQRGIWWKNLDTSIIEVTRGDEDYHADEIRVRIWVYE